MPQLVHEVRPSAAAIVPARQLEQTVEAEAAIVVEYFPVAQLVHTDDPAAVE